MWLKEPMKFFPVPNGLTILKKILSTANEKAGVKWDYGEIYPLFTKITFHSPIKEYLSLGFNLICIYLGVSPIESSVVLTFE